MERTIRKINAKKPKIPKRERVAAYARVSMDKETIQAHPSPPMRLIRRAISQ